MVAKEGKAAPKPVILISTDDGGQVVQLTPASDDPLKWVYETEVIYTNPKGTIGTHCVADTDGDHIPELFIPNNAEGTLSMWKWNATQTN